VVTIDEISSHDFTENETEKREVAGGGARRKREKARVCLRAPGG
jgi:hypothetical protein